jgi:hypothetical protein
VDAVGMLSQNARGGHNWLAIAIFASRKKISVIKKKKKQLKKNEPKKTPSADCFASKVVGGESGGGRS